MKDPIPLPLLLASLLLDRLLRPDLLGPHRLHNNVIFKVDINSQAKLLPSLLVSLMFLSFLRTSWYFLSSVSFYLLLSFMMSSFSFSRSLMRQFSSLEYCSSSSFVFALIYISLWPMLFILFISQFFSNSVLSSSPRSFSRCLRYSFRSARRLTTSSFTFSFRLSASMALLASSNLRAMALVSCLQPRHLLLTALMAPSRISMFLVHSWEMLKDCCSSLLSSSSETVWFCWASSSSSICLSSSLLSVKLLSWESSDRITFTRCVISRMMSYNCFVLFTQAFSISKQLFYSWPPSWWACPGALVRAVFRRVASSLSTFLDNLRMVRSLSSIISLRPEVIESLRFQSAYSPMMDERESYICLGLFSSSPSINNNNQINRRRGNGHWACGGR